MSVGTLSRRHLREVLMEALRETLSGAQEVPHIRLDAVPQGIADRGFALEGFRSRDEGGRNRRGTHVPKLHTVSIRYAKRLGTAHDPEEDRGVAEDDLDGLERAVRNSSAPTTAEYSCIDFASNETVDKTGEWLLVDITAEVLCQFRLRDPDAVAEGLQ